MAFESPLLLLLLLPLAVLGIVLASRASRHQARTAATYRGIAPRQSWFRLRLVFAGVFLLALSLVAARPYVAYTESGRYLFVVDVSRSMQARFSCAEPTFLERAKTVLGATVEALPQAEFGIFAFDRFAFPVTQMTADPVYLADVIRHGLYVGLMLEATQTEIANALTVVADKMDRLPGVYGNVSHVILLSDGHVGGAYERRLREPLERLAAAGVSVSTVGIGNPEPTPIADSDDGECIGQPIEVNGERVLIPLRDDILKFIAAAGTGNYYTERETGRLAEALRNELTPALTGDAAGDGPRRDISGFFVVAAALALLGFLYWPARFPDARRD